MSKSSLGAHVRLSFILTGLFGQSVPRVKIDEFSVFIGRLLLWTIHLQ